MVMKKKPMGSILFTLAVLAALSWTCNTRVVNVEDKMSRKIDSLVNVHHLNEKCILVTFGADAISAINTKNGIVVIDAGISTGLTRKYRKIIEKEFPAANVAWVINTHGHHDHIRGDAVFPEARVLAHRAVPGEMAGQWKNPDMRMQYMYRLAEEYDRQLDTLAPNTADWAEAFTQMVRCRFSADDIRDDIPLRYPDTTFSDSLALDMGDISLEMIHFGKCHSASDILVYTPELKLLFTGDLVARYGVPSINDTTRTDSLKWKRAVHWTDKRMDNIDLAIGGHGQILSATDIQAFNRKIMKTNIY